MESPAFLLAALLAFLVLAEAHRSRSRYNYGRAPPAGLYSWTRDLGRNRRCHEYAYAPPGGNVVSGTSTDAILSSVGVTPANYIYDYTNAVPVGFVAPENGPCFYSNTTMTLGQTLGTLDAINNTQIPPAEAVPLDGTSAPVASSDIQSIYDAYPSVEPACQGREVIPVYPQGAAPVAYTGPTETIKVFILNSAATIRVRQRSRYNNYRGQQRYGGRDDRDRYHRHRHG